MNTALFRRRHGLLISFSDDLDADSLKVLLVNAIKNERQKNIDKGLFLQPFRVFIGNHMDDLLYNRKTTSVTFIGTKVPRIAKPVLKKRINVTV